MLLLGGLRVGLLGGGCQRGSAGAQPAIAAACLPLYLYTQPSHDRQPHFSTVASAGLPAVAPLLPQLAAAITGSLAAVVAAAQQQQQHIAALVAGAGAAGSAQRQQQQPAKGLTPELAAESGAAAVLLTLLVQLSEQAALAAGGGQELPAELQPAAKAAAAVAAADFGGGVVRLPSQGISLVEYCLEVRCHDLLRWQQLGTACYCPTALPFVGCGGVAHRRLTLPMLLPCRPAERRAAAVQAAWAAARTARWQRGCRGQVGETVGVVLLLLWAEHDLPAADSAAANTSLCVTTHICTHLSQPPLLTLWQAARPLDHPQGASHIHFCRHTHTISDPLSSTAIRRLLDRWIILGGARDIAEMFVPAMGALGRWVGRGGQVWAGQAGRRFVSCGAAGRRVGGWVAGAATDSSHVAALQPPGLAYSSGTEPTERPAALPLQPHPTMPQGAAPPLCCDHLQPAVC